MNAKQIINVMGGQQAVANLLNEYIGLPTYTRSRIHNWYKNDRIPAWAVLAFPKLWARAERKILAGIAKRG